MLNISRLSCLLALTLLLTGCATGLNLFKWAYDCPSNTDTSNQFFVSPDADHLVVFVHGLCGDAKTTWTNTTTHFVFPEELARDFAAEKQPAYVVVYDYVSRLEGGPSILSIADHLEFEIGELLKNHPYRTLRIVAHSMGGLVAREYILRRQPRAHPQLKVTNVVLLATPNNGSELADLGQLIPSNRQIEELRHIDKGNTYLESLNKDWNAEFKGGGHSRHLLLYAGYEELSRLVIGRVVTLSSAIPYADESMGFQQDHIGIAKPKDANDVTYRWVKAKLGESLEKVARQQLAGMVKQGLLATEDIPQQLPRTVELLEGLQSLAGTELGNIWNRVKSGDFQTALALLDESEPKENQLVENTAKRRFTKGEIHQLLFQMTQAASYYSQAVQLAPTNAWYRNRYGWFLIHTGDARGAKLQFEETARLSQTSGNSYLEAAGLGGLGVTYADLEQYDKAIEYLKQALAIHRTIGDMRGEGSVLGNLGTVCTLIEQDTKAIDYFEQALAIHRKIGNVLGEARVLGNLGNAYDHLRQYTEAIKYHKKSLAIHRKIGDVRGEGGVLGNLGSTYVHLGQDAEAIEYFEQALAIHRKIGNVRAEGQVLGNLGITYAHLGQDAKAIEFLEKSRVIFEDRLRIRFPFKTDMDRLNTKPRN